MLHPLADAFEAARKDACVVGNALRDAVVKFGGANSLASMAAEAFRAEKAMQGAVTGFRGTTTLASLTVEALAEENNHAWRGDGVR